MKNTVNDNLWIEYPTKIKVSVGDLNKIMNECGLDSTDDDVVEIVYDYMRPQPSVELDFSEISNYDYEDVIKGTLVDQSMFIFEKRHLIEYVEKTLEVMKK